MSYTGSKEYPITVSPFLQFAFPSLRALAVGQCTFHWSVAGPPIRFSLPLPSFLDIQFRKQTGAFTCRYTQLSISPRFASER